MRLNGWERLGVLLTIAYVAAVLAFAAYEFSQTRYDKDCFNTVFIERSLPDAYVFSKPKINPETGSPFKPWEYDFCADKSVPVTESIRWGKLAVWCAIVPLVLWLFLLAIAWSFRWVKTGFAAPR